MRSSVRFVEIATDNLAVLVVHHEHLAAKAILQANRELLLTRASDRSPTAPHVAKAISRRRFQLTGARRHATHPDLLSPHFTRLARRMLKPPTNRNIRAAVRSQS